MMTAKHSDVRTYTLTFPIGNYEPDPDPITGITPPIPVPHITLKPYPSVPITPGPNTFHITINPGSIISFKNFVAVLDDKGKVNGEDGFCVLSCGLKFQGEQAEEPFMCLNLNDHTTYGCLSGGDFVGTNKDAVYCFWSPNGTKCTGNSSEFLSENASFGFPFSFSEQPTTVSEITVKVTIDQSKIPNPPCGPLCTSFT